MENETNKSEKQLNETEIDDTKRSPERDRIEEESNLLKNAKTDLSQEERTKRMIDVINKEFATCINQKKVDLASIDETILKGKELPEYIKQYFFRFS